MNAICQQFQEQLLANGFTGDISQERSDIKEHATDESIFYIEPELVIYPHNTDDLVRAIAAVNQLTSSTLPLHLTPRAAGTGLSGGSLNNSVVINTTRHFNTIHGHVQDGNDILFDVDPGVYYRDLEQIMNQYGVYIPSFPASKDICTIGGMVANNSAGPDSFHYGHTARFVASMNVMLSDGNEYTIQPLTWDEFNRILARPDLLGDIYRHVWDLLNNQESLIEDARPKTAKNSAGYALWDVISTTTAEFKKGRGLFDLTQLFSGSQGTLGVITRLTMRAVPRKTNTDLLVFPIFDLDTVGSVINDMVVRKPLSIELFDGPSYGAAMDHPDFFRDRIDPNDYKKTISYLSWIFRKRFAKQLPHFVLLVTLEQHKTQDNETIVNEINQTYETRGYVVEDPYERDMLWQVRRASYSLSKFADPNKRPAAFLEDMTVRPEQLGSFFAAINELFTKYDVQAYVHGHGGNGHLHFYPLMDFTDPNTSGLITQMSEDFFTVAVEHGGNICGEHNDGIIRTPHLDKMFSPEILRIFEQFEQVCDPLDIYNPGKKVNPKFDIQQVTRHSN